MNEKNFKHIFKNFTYVPNEKSTEPVKVKNSETKVEVKGESTSGSRIKISSKNSDASKFILQNTHKKNLSNSNSYASLGRINKPGSASTRRSSSLLGASKLKKSGSQGFLI